MTAPEIPGQMSALERDILSQSVQNSPRKPECVLEVGTWLGGGSTLHLLRALEKNGTGHLWGIEADQSIYQKMLANIRAAAPEAAARFTPLFGRSTDVIPRWLKSQAGAAQVDIAFLDGGNNPGEQIQEFQLLDPHIPVGGQLLSHDANMRKGKWLVPYLSRLDNWKVDLHESENGLMHATKLAAQPSSASRRKANRKLLSMRVHPVEIAAAILPAGICGWVLRLLPSRFARRIAEGCD